MLKKLLVVFALFAGKIHATPTDFLFGAASTLILDKVNIDGIAIKYIDFDLTDQQNSAAYQQAVDKQNLITDFKLLNFDAHQPNFTLRIITSTNEHIDLKGVYSLCYYVQVFNKTIAAGTIITEADIMPLQIDKSVDLRPYAVHPQDVVGRQARKNLKANVPIHKNDLLLVPVVKAHDIVDLVYDKGGVHIKTQATAQSNGAIGSIIKVKNDRGQIVRAKVIGENMVQLEAND